MHLTGHWAITGGAGFLGRAIIRRAIAESWDVRFTLISRGDSSHALIAPLVAEAKAANIPISLVRCAIERDGEMLDVVLDGADGVIHAAATKHVDLAEVAAVNTVLVNVEGSRRVFEAALRGNVPRLVAISTDKACLPVNVYGMTKALMERMVSDYALLGQHSRRWATVRYGNVVGSTGSVVPRFRAEALQRGRLTVTDPFMTRFWMSPSQAVDAVLDTLEHAKPGETVIPACAAMSLGDLVKVAFPDGQVPPVDVVGPRPGEKLHEELVHVAEAVRGRVWQIGGGRASVTYASLRPASMVVSQPAEPWAWRSDDPPGGTVPIETMRRWMVEAEAV